MSAIKILPEELANQIAAGEVVERPASVVKEFVENCLDAGAGQISVEVEGGGTRLIRVIDDGRGMDQDDVLLCLERHATSKLRKLDDLAAITTMGFRGEAVPAIASVCRLTITSRPAGQELGCRAEVRYGQVRKIHEAGCARGTTMEVRDLFGNVPARRKFLKSRRTELFHIEEAVLGAALAHPQVAMRYLVDGREIFAFAGQDDPARRVDFVLKRRSKAPLVTVQSCESVAEGAVAVRGWFLPPEETAAAHARLRLFVADRPVRDRMISHAVSEGMHGFLGKGRRPVGMLFVDLPPELVDVNVHPAKQEIRFRNSQLVHQLVSQAVRQGMESFQQEVKYALFGAAEAPAVKEQPKVEPQHESAPVATPRPLFQGQWRPSPSPSESFTRQDLHSEQWQPPARKNIEVAEPPATEAPLAATAESPPAPAQRPAEAEVALPRYLAQVADSYILCESPGGLLVIDQHAAHERLLYERLRRHYLEGKMASQGLLFAEMVECSPEQQAVLEGRQDDFSRLGLDIHPLGGETWAIKAIPSLLAGVPPLEIFHGIMAHYLADGTKDAASVEKLLASMACKAAVKAHDPLTREEGEALVAQMVAADIFSHCPHGRPVVRLFSPQEMGRWFKRS